MEDNINILLDKMEHGRVQGLKDLKEDHGPNKWNRANSKMTEIMKPKEMDDLKASTMNINILADQVANVVKNL